MQLDPPPMFEHLLLESPWAVMGVFVILAVTLLMVGRRQRKRWPMFAGGLAVGAALGVYFLAGSVTTVREQIIRNTEALVAATAPLDTAALNRLIDPQAVVTGPHGDIWVSAGQVVPRVDAVLSRFPLNTQTIRSLDAAGYDNGWADSVVTVRTDPAGGNGPVNSGWRLSWRQDPQGTWTLVDIRWMKFNGMDVQQGMMP